MLFHKLSKFRVSPSIELAKQKEGIPKYMCEEFLDDDDCEYGHYAIVQHAV
jgi:hypothetical protein